MLLQWRACDSCTDQSPMHQCCASVRLRHVTCVQGFLSDSPDQGLPGQCDVGLRQSEAAP